MASALAGRVADGGSLRPFLRRWLVCSLAGAAVMSIVDGVLLQRRESYFTGGFLSRDHLAGPTDVALFLSVSFLADLAVTGAIAAAVMLMFPRLRPRASAVAGVMSGLSVLLAADVLAYQLVLYLGDALDVALMFELTGNSVAELLAVSGAYLVTPAILAVCGVIAGTGVVHVINRRDGAQPVVGRPPVKAIAVPLIALAVALVATATAAAFSDALENGLARKPSSKVLTLVADALTDFDRDGFGITGRLADPAPANAQVYPYALDIPGNGIDEDGVGGDLAATAGKYLETSAGGQWARRPDVVLVVLESFRFDLLGARFDQQPITPVLNDLGARGVSSTRAYSHNGYTAQSRFHLLTGSLAGIRGGTSLIDDFKANGYFVAYVSGQDESFGGPRYDSGFSRADVHYDARSDRQRRYSTFSTAGSLAVPFTVVAERVADTLRTTPGDRPLFLYVNLHDTHFPYTHDGVAALTSSVRLPRERIVPGERSATWATYVNTAANVDRAVGQILENVRRVRGHDPSVIATSDHGESLFDDGFLGHGHQLNDVQTQVPFIVVDLPVVIEEPFGQVELRNALGAAMRVDPALPSTPRRIASPAREVFQYLGNVNRPRQIAFSRGDGRIIYDFRSGRAQVRGGSWVAPGELSDADATDFKRLVEYWERMMLARRGEATNG